MEGKRQSKGGEKANSEHLVYGNRQGQIEFGHLHLGQNGKINADVTSGVFLQAGGNARHYITMDIDGAREGWTSNRSPGPYQVWCASDHAGNVEGKSKDWAGVGFFLLAENGDIIIRAPKGRIRMSAMDIDIRAEGPDLTRGSINLDSNESVNIKTETFDVTANKGLKLFSPKSVEIVANTSLNLVGNFVSSLSAASNYKPDKLNPITTVKMLLKQNYSIF